MNKVLQLFTILLLLGCVAGCQSIKTMLNPPPQEKTEEQKAAMKQRRSPTDVLPFKAKGTPPPSMFDSSLSEQERALLKEYQKSGEIEPTPDTTKGSSPSRNWVFGY